MPEFSQFAMPESLDVDTETASDTYARFITQPWEKGFGHTLGNAFRRVLLSSLEGVAITSVRIDGVAHEFSTIPDVLEDVTDIVLNLKKVKFRCDGELPRTVELYTEKAGEITAAAIKEDGVATVLNPDQYICTLDADKPLRMELSLDIGRGYRGAESNKEQDQPIGVIPMDCVFSPVERVRYDVQTCRVGQRTDYDRLELDVWTDARQTPQEAVKNAAEILEAHLDVFLQKHEEEAAEENVTAEGSLSDEDKDLIEKMCMPIKEIGLSSRARNCLASAGIEYTGQLIQKTDEEMLKFRNFGQKSLDEIKKNLSEEGLSIGMKLSDSFKSQLFKRLRELGVEPIVKPEGGEDKQEPES
ncbi:MAG: DNA-directed RNA polymerase subunit alpha [Lentisphaeria bacterium]